MSTSRPDEVMILQFGEDGSSRYRLWQVSVALADRLSGWLETEIGSATADQLQTAEQAAALLRKDLP